MRISNLKYLIPAMIVLAVYQNCSELDSAGTDGERAESEANNSLKEQSCYFNGVEVASGQELDAYRLELNGDQKACLKTSRSCTDGKMSGDSSYYLDSCSVDKNAEKTSCQAFTQNYPHDYVLRTFSRLRAVEDKACDEFLVTSRCTDGQFDMVPGEFETCLPEPKGQNCFLHGIELPHGSKDWIYSSNQVDLRSSSKGCRGERQAKLVECNNGQVLFGNGIKASEEDLSQYPYLSCAELGASCQLLGEVVSHGSSFKVYKQSQFNYAQQSSCDHNENSLVGICANGRLMSHSGPERNPIDVSGYNYRECKVIGNSCGYQGSVFEHNQLVGLFYKQNQVQFTKMNGRADISCSLNENSKAAKCIDGVISNSVPSQGGSPTRHDPFDFAKFSHSECRSIASGCEAYGESFAHAEVIGPRYKKSSIVYSETEPLCDDIENKVSLLCVNGALNEYVDETDERFRREELLRRDVDASIYSYSTCRVTGADCTHQDQTYRHGQRIGPLGRLFRYSSRPFDLNEVLCESNGNSTYAKCVHGVIKDEQNRRVDTAVFTNTVCGTVGSSCEFAGRERYHLESFYIFKTDRVSSAEASSCAANDNGIKVTCLDGKLYTFELPHQELDTSAYLYDSCRRYLFTLSN